MDALGRGENGFVTVDGISFIYIYMSVVCSFKFFQLFLFVFKE